MDITMKPPSSQTASRWLLLLMGGLGLAGAAVQLGRGLIRGATVVDNPVFANVQRLPHEQTILYHASSYGTDLLILSFWLLFLVLIGYVAVVLLHALYQRAPVPTLAAGAFLFGALISGLLIATSLMKVAEFVVQMPAATAAEAAWLTSGINYLMQLHLFYVWGWIFATGVGWLFLAAAARRAGDSYRRGALLLFAGGGLFVAATVFRALLPFAGPTAPGLLIGFIEAVPSAAFGAGLLGYAALLRRLSADAAALPAPRRDASVSDPRVHSSH
jgi:hypothetical protein